ncbi:MAG: hypothetical protein MK108_12230 [Mariniblastus sp.]|nr:hypothetical protein [Mariniblastus sp.]
MNTLLMAALFTLCSDTFAWQDNEGEATRQTEPAIDAYAAYPTFYTVKKEPCLGCYRAHCGRQITSYQAIDLWRGYCNEDCSYQHHGHGACVGSCPTGWKRPFCQTRARCSRGGCRNPACDR